MVDIKRPRAIKPYIGAFQTHNLKVAGSNPAPATNKIKGLSHGLRQRQHDERVQLAAVHKAARLELQSAYLAEQRRIRLERARRQPKGLAAFLGRVTGIALMTKKRCSAIATANATAPISPCARPCGRPSRTSAARSPAAMNYSSPIYGAVRGRWIRSKSASGKRWKPPR